MTNESSRERLDGLLGRLSFEEKIALCSGGDAWSTHAIPRLGIPSLRMNDGPTGARSNNSEPATVFPVATALAASWNPKLVAAVSAAIAREVIALGGDVLLAPGLNLQRTATGGRNFEYFSEDPLLISVIGAAYVSGVQSEGVAATAKHFVANDQEDGRMTGSSEVASDVLADVYLAPFQDVIERSDPWLIMSAYNQVNGCFASESESLLTQLLKATWGYSGVIVSDWGAVHDVRSFAAGLDLEMPGPARRFGARLAKALEDGEISTGRLDDAVMRLLRLVDRCGQLDGNPKRRRAELASEAHQALAREAATQAVVLLKNDGDLLPLDGRKIGRLAIIGRAAATPTIQGSGSSQVTPTHIATPLEALRQALPGCAVDFVGGIDPAAGGSTLCGSLVSVDAEGCEPGLMARYWKTPDASGPVAIERIERYFAKGGFGAEAQASDGAFSVAWSGFFNSRSAGDHRFEFVASRDADLEFALGDVRWRSADHDPTPERLFGLIPVNRWSVTVSLPSGASPRIRLGYARGGDARGHRRTSLFFVRLREPPATLEAITSACQQADAAVVFVGAAEAGETEGFDRTSLQLPERQDAVVEAALAANPRTVVVLNSGAPVEMPWLGKARAVVQMWLPGEQGGPAIADILLGKASPSGRLPHSMPRQLDASPATGKEGDDHHYREGHYVGYRWYASRGIAPAFPFGHGLTYSRFHYTSVVAPETHARSADLIVAASIANVGRWRASEVVQVYLSVDVDPGLERRLTLAGFDRVTLDPGETRVADICISAAYLQRALAGQPIAAKVQIEVGASAGDIRWSRLVTIN